ncbi:MAG: DNA repair protein RecO [Actinobacteria bacterium]|nr:MAG: DNA repair protein RecO [Actinomycetota bacterium]
MEMHAGLREDYDRSCGAAVVFDFCDKVSLEGQAEERMFPLAVTALDVLAAADAADVRALVTAFLIKAMAVQGYRPQLAGCVHCASEKCGAGFSIEAGGVVCAECAGEDEAVVPLSSAGRSAIGALMGARMAEVAALGVPDEVLDGVARLVRTFVQHHLPARMKSLGFLG